MSCGVALLCCVALLPLAISFCPSSLHAPGVLATGRYSNPLLKHRHREWARVSLVKNARCNTEGLRGAQSSTEWGQGAVKLAVGGMADLKNQVLTDDITAKFNIILQLGLTDVQLAVLGTGLVLLFSYLLSTPSPLFGIIDGLLLRPLDAGAEKPWGPDDISPKVGRTLGRGTFGTAFEAFTTPEGNAKLKTQGDGSSRVVLKRLTEDGQAEIEAYFNRRVRRIGQPQHFATFLGGSRRQGDASGSERLLVWRYEGSRTLEMFIAEAGFPLNMEEDVIFRNRLVQPAAPPSGSNTLDRELPKRTSTMVRVSAASATLARQQQGATATAASRTLRRGAASETLVADPPKQAPKSFFGMGGGGANDDVEMREARVVRKVLQETLLGLKALHSAGIVHRDVKPANILIAETSQGSSARLIDLGAAVDLRNGFNFDPEKGLLDPRYAPPEQYIVPRDAPPPPGGLLTLLGSPFFWGKFSPDRFDTYSVGMTLLQMAVPQLRPPSTLKTVNSQLKEVGGDVEAWRERYGTRYDFAMLDRKGGAGWDLVTKLIRPQEEQARRLSAAQALGHRYFSGQP